MLISTNNRAFQNKSLGVKISEFDAFFKLSLGLIKTIYTWCPHCTFKLFSSPTLLFISRSISYFLYISWWCRKRRLFGISEIISSSRPQSSYLSTSKCCFQTTSNVYFSLSVILFLVGVIPCPERHNCSDCLQGDDFCYYCSSNDSCDYYRESHHGNKCPRNNLFFDECPTGGSLFWVLFPILAIILIPVIVYAVIWLICWCMKSAGYDPLDPTEPPPKKHPKGIRLKPGSPSNRTDELRRKYDLDNS